MGEVLKRAIVSTLHGGEKGGRAEKKGGRGRTEWKGGRRR
jgi:hypothetical protein